MEGGGGHHASPLATAMMTDRRLSALAMFSIKASCVRSLDLDDVIKASA